MLEFPLLVLAAMAIGFGPQILEYLRGRMARYRMVRWRAAARQAGLSDLEPAFAYLDARSGSIRVRLWPYREEETEGTYIDLWGERLAPGLSLQAEGAGSLLGRRASKEIEVGDEAFDRQVSVQGAPALALALLDPDMRRTMAALVRGRLEVRGHLPLRASGQVRDGVLRVQLPERSTFEPGTGRGDDAEPPLAGDGMYRLPAALRAALDLARRLVAHADLAPRLASNLAGEPEAGVRLKTLLTLLREFPEHAATREAIHAAREDPAADVRVRAAIALGADGRDVLLGVARGEGAGDATSARAVAALGRSLSLEAVTDLLKHALRTRRLETARECLGILGGLGSSAVPSAVPIVVKVLLVEKGELGEAAAAALAATGDPAAEASLLRALAEGSPQLRRAAASALARVGTRAAVLPLREAEQGDGALRGVARQAIAEIHARLAGAAQGQLSLADGESGRLSIAEDETGRLSLSDGGGVRS